MGTIFSKTMEENLKKNQEFITEMNKITVSNMWYIYFSHPLISIYVLLVLLCDEYNFDGVKCC
jgi:ABC-type transport system substrate-binding protein